jgi:hypothetical protein
VVRVVQTGPPAPVLFFLRCAPSFHLGSLNPVQTKYIAATLRMRIKALEEWSHELTELLACAYAVIAKPCACAENRCDPPTTASRVA